MVVNLIPLALLLVVTPVRAVQQIGSFLVQFSSGYCEEGYPKGEELYATEPHRNSDDCQYRA